MRIAVASPLLSGGTGKQVSLLADGLCRRGHEVTVIAPRGEVPIRPIEAAALETPGQGFGGLGPMAPLARYFGFALALRRAALERFDIVHVHGWQGLLLGGAVRSRLVSTFHGSAIDEARHARPLSVGSLGWMLWQAAVIPLERLAARRAARLAGVSPATVIRLPAGAEVIANAVDLESYSPSSDPREPDHPVILCVSTGAEGRKRIPALIDAFTETVRPAIADAELWLVLPRQIEVPAGVRCLSGISEAELIDAYRRATLFCLPSTYEGFGVPYVEAMACGTPVLATPNAGARWVLGDGAFGAIADEADIPGALLDLLRSPQRLAELRTAGLRRAEDFSLSKMVDAYERAYTELAA